MDVLMLNLGADRQFKLAARHLTGLVAGYAQTRANADIFIAATRSPARVAALLNRPIGLLHVLGHGAPEGTIHAGRQTWRPPKVYSLDDLAGLVRVTGEPLVVDGLLLDACDTFSPRWRSGVARVIAPGRQVVMIGTRRQVGWDEASTFTGSFYAALLRRRWARTPRGRREAFADAFERASSATETLLGSATPFRMTIVTGAAEFDA